MDHCPEHRHTTPTEPSGGRHGDPATSGGMRRLPWTTDLGKPCYLVGGGTGHVSRVADDLEEARLDTASEILDQAVDLLTAEDTGATQLRALATGLLASLYVVHVIAAERGERLTGRRDDPGMDDVHDDTDGSDDDGGTAGDDTLGGPCGPAGESLDHPAPYGSA